MSDKTMTLERTIPECSCHVCTSLSDNVISFYKINKTFTQLGRNSQIGNLHFSVAMQCIFCIDFCDCCVSSTCVKAPAGAARAPAHRRLAAIGGDALASDSPMNGANVQALQGLVRVGGRADVPRRAAPRQGNDLASPAAQSTAASPPRRPSASSG